MSFADKFNVCPVHFKESNPLNSTAFVIFDASVTIESTLLLISHFSVAVAKYVLKLEPVANCLQNTASKLILFIQKMRCESDTSFVGF